MSGEWVFFLIPVLIDAIAVMGLYVIANTGRLSVGQAAFFGIGGYASAILSRKGVPPLASIAAGILISGASGVIFAAVADRLSHWFYAITTLAFSVMIIGVVSLVETLGGATGLYGVPLVVGFSETVGAMAIVVMLVVWLDHSSFGRSMRAVRESELAAQALAIDPRRIRVVAFGIGTALAGFAGGLWAHYLGLIKPGDLSLDRSLLYLIYLSIGGLEFWGGALLGTLFLGLLPEALRFSREFRLAVFGALLTLVMVLRPSGLLSYADLRSFWRRLRMRRAA